MPNWVYNGVSITADTKEELEAVKQALAKPSETWYTDIGDDKPTRRVVKTPFNFFNVIHPPEDILDKDGDYWNSDLSSGWYVWNIDNWGTKWNAAETMTDQFDELTITYRFSTAWDLPRGIILALPKVFPNISFQWYAEEENGWGEAWEYNKGEPEPRMVRTWEESEEEEEEEVEA